jgi:putative oxidoreductase
MRIVVTLARLLLGLIFLVFGLNGFLLFMPPPAYIPGNAGAFSGAMMTSHYVYLTAGVQVLAGVLLLINQYVPLALVILAAVIVNILTFHLTMWQQYLLPFPVLVTVLWFVVAWPLRTHFAPLFARKVEIS